MWTLTLTTTMHTANHTVVPEGGHVPLGTVMHDNATLNGAVAGFTPTGLVSFLLNGAPVANGATDPGFYATSVNSAPLAAGNYTYDASYAGDANYNPISFEGAPDEHFVVDKGTLTLTTTVHDANHNVVPDGGHVALGSVMHDNATLIGANPNFAPTGAVTFAFSGGPLGPNAPTEPPFYATSANTAPLAAGNYSFSAAFAGDSNYNAITSGTHNPETFIVDKGTLTLTTVMHDAAHSVIPEGGHVPVGTITHDGALLSGANPNFAPTGAVSFTLNGVPVANVAPEPGFYATSADSIPLAPAGNYTYDASYAGDSNYNPISFEGTADEHFVVDK